MVYWIIAFCLLLLALLLRLFIKRTLYIGLILFFVTVGAFLIFEQTKNTTFVEAYDDLYEEDVVIEEMTVGISDGPRPDFGTEHEVTVENPEQIERVLEDLSRLELKREEDYDFTGEIYQVRFVVTDNYSEGFSETDYSHVFVGEDHVNTFKITNDPEHLNTLQSLIEK
ncbi:hypothetical protein LCM20_01595 [Halobacillus litoralis]|uniref:hypothetical protein n=1 Tax=Halobacillus litoralis TaxID=45668 RepID=UPI001CD73E1E|nr:hypothetical protein [Halobacillus litoralis]MCA0969280.1 hypothetical protein [Halobacillus litoralis]